MSRPGPLSSTDHSVAAPGCTSKFLSRRTSESDSRSVMRVGALVDVLEEVDRSEVLPAAVRDRRAPAGPAGRHRRASPCPGCSPPGRRQRLAVRSPAGAAAGAAGAAQACTSRAISSTPANTSPLRAANMEWSLCIVFPPERYVVVRRDGVSVGLANSLGPSTGIVTAVPELRNHEVGYVIDADDRLW